jgi:hypothetical protein
MSMLYNKIKIEIDINNDDHNKGNHIRKHHENKNREKGANF